MSLDQTQPTQPTQPTEPGQAFQPMAPEPGPFQVPPQPVPAAKPTAKGRGTSWINVALGLALAVAIGGVAFAAGRMTAPRAASANGGGAGNGGFRGQGGYFPGGGNFQGGGGNGGFGRPGGGGASVQGTVTAVTPTSITMTTASGQTVTINLNSATTYHQQASATASDVKSGSTVIVRIGFAGQGGPTASGAPGLSANDVTVVP